MSENAVSLQSVSKSFNFKRSNKLKSSENRLISVSDVSFDVSKGEILGIIGLNGSGKTTLLRLIAGIYEPDSGKISIEGKIAPLLQIGTGFNNELTGPENIVSSGMLYGFSKKEIQSKVKPILEFAELQEFRKMKFKHYSAGMKTRLAFSLAMQIDPDIILVDEVLSVGDFKFREKSLQAFLSFKNKKKTILFATHILNPLPELCDRVLILHKGEMIFLGDPKEAIQKYRSISEN
ncbi:MAG: ATP-binding cassette domain-containing protein [Nitrosopumilus sp.]|nr:ATP-binding cassette domain-containing protein [Nitrosopumilus sp.]